MFPVRISPGISHASHYSVPPPQRIDMRLLRRGIRESIFANFAVNLVDFPNAEYFRKVCHIILDLSKQHIPIHDLHFRGMDKHFLQFTAFTEDDVRAENIIAQSQVLL